jgi:hypothetical protein
MIRTIHIHITKRFVMKMRWVSCEMGSKCLRMTSASNSEVFFLILQLEPSCVRIPCILQRTLAVAPKHTFQIQYNSFNEITCDEGALAAESNNFELSKSITFRHIAYLLCESQ